MLEPNRLGNSDSSENKEGKSLLQVRLLELLREGLWLRWTLVTALGTTLGGAIGGLVWDKIGNALIVLAILGAATGMMQSLALRHLIRRTRQWVLISAQWTLANVIGWGLVGTTAGLAALLVLVLLQIFTGDWSYEAGYELLASPLPIVLIVLLGAASVSIIQQRILRTRFNSAGSWTSKSFIGWCVGWAIGLGVAYVTPGSDAVKGTAGGAIGGGRSRCDHRGRTDPATDSLPREYSLIVYVCGETDNIPPSHHPTIPEGAVRARDGTPPAARSQSEWAEIHRNVLYVGRAHMEEVNP